MHPASHVPNLQLMNRLNHVAPVLPSHTLIPLTATKRIGKVCIACGYKQFSLIADQLAACDCFERYKGYHAPDCPQLHPEECYGEAPQRSDGNVILLCPVCCDDLVQIREGDALPTFHSCGEMLEQAFCSECGEPATCVEESESYNRDGHNFEFWREPRCGKHGQEYRGRAVAQ